jgi:hypothetical protein
VSLRKGGDNVESGLGTPLQWGTLIMMIISLVTILLKIGNTQGKQEEKNINYEKLFETHEKHLSLHDVKFDRLEGGITAIKEDVSYIKGKLL